MKPLQVLIALFALAFLPLHAASLDDLTYTTTDGEVTITDCDTTATGELVIPNIIGGNPVTSIGDYAFGDCTSLTSVSFQGVAPTMGVNPFFGVPEGAKAYISTEAADSFGGVGSTWEGLTVAIESIIGLNDGLVAYYPFNGNANDESGNGNDGTVNGATLTLDRNGVADSAFDFDGDDFIKALDSETLRSGSITLSCWVYSENNNRYVIVISKITDVSPADFGDPNQPASHSYRIRLNGEVPFWEINTNNPWSQLSGSEISRGQWELLTVTWDGQAQKIYRNGQLDSVNENAADGNIRHLPGADLMIGRGWHPSSDFFDGQIDDVRVYNRALSEEEVTALYNLEKANPAPPLVQLGALYESPSGEAVVIDATPTAGFPAEFTYQWCFNGFKIPANLGGTASSINIDNLQANEGTWSVTVTNETGSVEQSFEYRIYADSDSDGLSDAYEELVSLTNINNSDTDNDGLADGDEVNTYSTNPNSSDSDSDGFTDLYELETAYDPNSAESTPDAQVNIMTAIEVDFNAALGATYEIQFSTDTIEWTVIEAGIVGEGNAVERLYSRKDFPTGFFRVERTDQ